LQQGVGYQGVKTPARHVRTRLYFTSESHLHSLTNLIRFGGLQDDVATMKRPHQPTLKTG